MTVKVTVISKAAGTAASHNRENSKYKQAIGFNKTITAVICSYNENSRIIPSIRVSLMGRCFPSSSMSLTEGLWDDDDEEEETEEDVEGSLENGVFLRWTPAWAVGKTDECVVIGSLVVVWCAAMYAWFCASKSANRTDSGLLHNRHDNQTNLSGYFRLDQAICQFIPRASFHFTTSLALTGDQSVMMSLPELPISLAHLQFELIWCQLTHKLGKEFIQ